MFFQSIQSVLIIVLIMTLGYILKKYNWFDEHFSTSISSLITKVALPCGIFVSVQKYLTLEEMKSLSGSLIYALASVGLMYIVAIILVKLLKIRPGRKGTFINTFANANTIFIGLPLNIALFGDKSLPYFLVYYVTNTLSTWAVGIFFIQNDATIENKSVQKNVQFNFKKLLPPPLVGLVVALFVLIVQIPIPVFLSTTLAYIGNLVTPLALIYVGIVLNNAKLSSIKLDRDTIWALIGRFVLSPLGLVLILYIGARLGNHLNPVLEKTLIVQSAAPALAVMPILVAEGKGDELYATNVVTTSTILFIVVIPILMQLLSYVK